jgi:tetratricopeptide (TPR) repeat protein
MAGDVARALGVAFDPVTETPVNSLAWEQVLLSRHLARSDNIEAAVKAIDRALEYQPDFPQTLAWKALYTTREIGRDEMTMNPEKAIGLAEAALKGVHRQIEFGANNAQTQFVAGFINHELGHWTEMLIPSLAAEGNSQAAGELRSQARERFLQAEKHFRTVRTLNPSFTGFGGLNIYSYLAGTLEHLGKDRRNEALEIYEAGVEVEPWSQWFNASLAQRRAARGRYREAMELLDRFRQLPDVPIGIWSARREIVLSLGYFDENCEGQLWIRQNEPEKLAPGLETRTGYITFFSRVLPYLGLEQETRDFLARFADIEEKPGHTLDHEYVFDRRTDEQILQLELLFNEGHPDEARPVLEELRRHLETEHDIGIRHPQTLRYLAETYAFLGRDEEALAMLKKAVDYHLRRNDFDEWDRLHSPWSRLREDPRFTAQWNRMARDLQQQAETIRAMLSRYDMGELVAPLKVEETK